MICVALRWGIGFFNLSVDVAVGCRCLHIYYFMYITYFFTLTPRQFYPLSLCCTSSQIFLTLSWKISFYNCRCKIPNNCRYFFLLNIAKERFRFEFSYFYKQDPYITAPIDIGMSDLCLFYFLYAFELDIQDRKYVLVEVYWSLSALEYKKVKQMVENKLFYWKTSDNKW